MIGQSPIGVGYIGQCFEFSFVAAAKLGELVYLLSKERDEFKGADAAKVPFTAQAFASQTADVAQFTDSGGAVMARVKATGNIEVPNQSYSSAWSASIEVPTKDAVYQATKYYKGVYTLAALNSAYPSPIVGDRSFITDETTGVFGAASVGGGSLEIPVFYGNGAWRNG